MRRFIPILSKPMALVAALASAGAALAQPTFDPAQFMGTGARPDGLCRGDFDGDGDVDFAVSTDAPDAVTVWQNQGNGTFSPLVPFLTGAGTGAGALAALDMDGDQDLDIVVVLKNANRAQVLTNSGVGTFSLGPSGATGAEPVDVALGDADGDGRFDIFTANRSADTVTVLRNTTIGLVLYATLSGGSDLRAVAAADFDGDGLAEALASSHDSREIVYHENVSGVFSSGVFYSVGGNVRPEGIAVGDFDGANGLDFAAATSGNGLNQAAVFLRNAGGTFSGPANYPLGGVDASGIVAVDLDCNGSVDLATSNQTSNDVSVIANSGNGTFGGPIVLPAGTNPGRILGGRFDLDADVELLVANRDSNSVAYYNNTTCNEVNVFATSVVVFPGLHLSGGLGEIRLGDDQYLTTQRNLAADELGFPITVTVTGTSPTASPSSFEFTVESRVEIGGLRQIVQLWDWVGAQWIVVDQRPGPQPDTVVVGAGTGDLSRFVRAGTLEVRAQVGIEEIALDSVIAWKAWFDQLHWTIGQ